MSELAKRKIYTGNVFMDNNTSRESQGYTYPLRIQLVKF